jgi:hypothetical protein
MSTPVNPHLQRVVECWEKNPDMTLAQLVERFGGWARAALVKWCRENGREMPVERYQKQRGNGRYFIGCS